jgi:hypothetical protein
MFPFRLKRGVRLIEGGMLNPLWFLSLGCIVTFVIITGVLVAVIFFVFGVSMNNSEAASEAKEFLKKNEILKKDIGEIKDFGSFPKGSIRTRNNDTDAELVFKVYGERKTVEASVGMMYREGRGWRVTAASYKNEQGKTIDLLNVYEDESGNEETQQKDKKEEKK